MHGSHRLVSQACRKFVNCTHRSPAAHYSPCFIYIRRILSAGPVYQPPASATARRTVITMAAFDEDDWTQITTHLRSSEEQRDSMNNKAREMQTLAKQAVFALHRGETAKADECLTKIEACAQEVQHLFTTSPHLRQQFYSNSVQDYAVAKILRGFLQEHRLLKSSELALANPEEYLNGVLGFTEELNRYAIQRATQRDVASVARCRDLVEALMGQFLQFDFRNSPLRKRYDGLKYTLKKLENTLYELSLTEQARQLQEAGAAAQQDKMEA